MADFFLDALSAISGADFDEKPVSLEEFVTSEDYLHLPPLSDHQYTMVRAMSQIYRLETLQSLYGDERGAKIFESTCTEVILQLAKGSGKNHSTTVAVLYLVYLLLCLKDPASYYGKPSGNNIDILNMAINAEQARNAFFNPLTALLKKCRWFDGRYEIKSRQIEFDKNINIYSGNSEHGAAEGLNIIVAVLDEISGVDVEGSSQDKLKTADGIYNALSATVTSRFADYGKVIMLSFPRYKDDFIQRKYNEAVAEKEVIIRTHTFKIDPSLPDGVDGNEFDIEWEEDHILRYTYPKLFALRRPTWEVNPVTKIEDFTRAFMTNPRDALSRFCALPSDNAEDNYFKNREAISAALTGKNGVDTDGVFSLSWMPKNDTDYFIHVDLSKVHDRCSVAIAHVEKWVRVEIPSAGYKETHPFVVVDAVRWWKPSKEDPMDFKEVEKFILEVQRRKFNVKLVTFDRWNSHDMINSLNKQGIKCELLSVGNSHYDDFTSVMYDRRLVAPNITEFHEELKALKWIKGKVDHPRSGYKDISDSVCGAIFNAVSHAKTPVNKEVEVITLEDLIKQEKEEKSHKKEIEQSTNRIEPPRRMPQNIEAYLGAGKII